MRSLNQYLELYAESHTHQLNLLIHKICVPAIMWSVLGIFHTVQISGVPLSYLVTALALVFYFRLSKKVFLAMVIVSLLMLYSFAFVPKLGLVCVVVFVIAWIGQFWGHFVEGAKPSFIDDLKFLLIGPVWVLVSLGIIKNSKV